MSRKTQRSLASQGPRRHNPPVRCRLGLTLLLATNVACFSDPPETPTSSGGSTSTDASSSDSETTSVETSGTAESGSSTTAGTTPPTTSAETEGSSSSTTTSAGSTGEPPGETLLDLFTDCERGDWESSGNDIKMQVGCGNDGFKPVNVFGGGWRFDMFDSPSFGAQQNVLILRPRPIDDGTVSVRFDAGPDGFAKDGVLEFDYEFVNTLGPDAEGRIGFQAFLLRPSDNIVEFVQEFGPQSTGLPVGHSGTVSMDTAVLGPNDQLVFFVRSNVFTTGQGVALYDARIVASN